MIYPTYMCIKNALFIITWIQFWGIELRVVVQLNQSNPIQFSNMDCKIERTVPCGLVFRWFLTEYLLKFYQSRVLRKTIPEHHKKFLAMKLFDLFYTTFGNFFSKRKKIYIKMIVVFNKKKHAKKCLIFMILFSFITFAISKLRCKSLTLNLYLIKKKYFYFQNK